MSEHDVMAKCTAQLNRVQDDNARLRHALRTVRDLLARGCTNHLYLPVDAQHAQDVITQALGADTGD